MRTVRSTMAKAGNKIPKTTIEPRSEARWLDYLKRPVWICALLAVATLAVYSGAGRSDFVNYDDADYVTANRHVQNGLTWEGVAWAFHSGYASNWHPLTWLSHMLDCQLFGQEPGPMHFVNVCFHVINSLLVYLVLRRITGAHWRSAVVAGLFALHPLHVESVAWISERKDVLSGLFFILTIWAWARYVGSAKGDFQPLILDNLGSLEGDEHRTPNKGRNEPRGGTVALRERFEVGSLTRERNRRWIWYNAALVCFALGLMSKPMLVTLPFLLLLLDYWPLGRSPEAPLIGSHSRTGYMVRSWWWLVGEKAPFFVLAAVSSYVTFQVQRKGGAVSTSLSLGGRLANAVVSHARYLGKTFWPVRLSVLYPHPGFWPAPAVVAATVLLVVIFALVIWQARRRPYLAVGWLWFAGSLVPVIGLVQVGIQSMADRYTYVPSIGLFLALVWGVGELKSKREHASEANRSRIRAASLQPVGQDSGTMLVSAAAVLALVICGLLTARQVGFWRDSEKLFLHAIQATSRNYLAYNNLGYYLSNHGRNAEAMTYYSNSLAINPRYEDALNNMGYALAGQKKYPEAIQYYEAALRVRPNQAEVRNNLGNALSELGNIPEAINQYRMALREKPDHADAHNNLGIALAMQGNVDEAIGHFREALRYKPNYASAHSNLGNALAARRKFEEAAREYQEALRLNPADPQAHNNLGNVLAELGKLDEAIPQYREALRLNADNPEAHFNLGIALTRQGKGPEAIAHLTEALRLKPDYADARKELDRLRELRIE